MDCTAPLFSPQNGTISDHSVPAIPGRQVAFQCENGLFPEGIMTATCLATGEWDKNPGEIICRYESSKSKFELLKLQMSIIISLYTQFPVFCLALYLMEHYSAPTVRTLT